MNKVKKIQKEICLNEKELLQLCLDPEISLKRIVLYRKRSEFLEGCLRTEKDRQQNRVSLSSRLMRVASIFF